MHEMWLSPAFLAYVLFWIVIDAYLTLNNDEKFVAIVSLLEYEVPFFHSFVAQLSAHFKEMLILNLSLFEEMILSNVRNKLVEILIVSCFWVLFQNIYNVLNEIRNKQIPEIVILD